MVFSKEVRKKGNRPQTFQPVGWCLLPHPPIHSSPTLVSVPATTKCAPPVSAWLRGITGTYIAWKHARGWSSSLLAVSLLVEHVQYMRWIPNWFAVATSRVTTASLISPTNRGVAVKSKCHRRCVEPKTVLSSTPPSIHRWRRVSSKVISLVDKLPIAEGDTEEWVNDFSMFFSKNQKKKNSRSTDSGYKCSYFFHSEIFNRH